MEYGFKKGHKETRTVKKIFVFQVIECKTPSEAAIITGVKLNSVNYLAKNEKAKNGYIFSFNEFPGMIPKSY